MRSVVVRFVRWPVCRLAVVVFVAATFTRREGLDPATGVLFAQEATPEFECQSYCSPSKPGTPVMEVKWRIAPTLLTPAQRRARVAQQTLDATVYSDGFERGLYVTLPTTRPRAIFGRPRGLAAPPRPIPGLRRLVVTDVQTTQDRGRSQPSRLLAVAPADEEWVAVKIEGIDPGLDYTYRVPAVDGGRTVITCQAATCPVDHKRAPASARANPNQ